MINPSILKSVGVALNIIRPLFFALIGGLVAGGVQNCSDRQPVSLVITNQQYESQIRTLQKQQDSLARTLPDVRAAMRYITSRYGAGVDSSKIARDLQICEVATRELDLTRQFNSRLTRQLNDEIFAHQQTRLALDRVKRQATRNGWVAVGASAALLIQTLILLRP
jgi:hypothetical protein